MARLSKEKIDEIRASVDIVDVIGQYLSLHKKGKNGYVALCPFHNDSDPSLSISQTLQIYKCFVCGKGGNVFTFLQDYLNISYIESVKKVAEIGNIDLSEYEFDQPQRKINTKHAPLYAMHKEAMSLYSYYLDTKLGLEARAYLNSRHFSDEIIKEFQIGYAPLNPVLYNVFDRLGFDPIDMVNSGLVLESDQHYDRFSDRIVFPLYNDQGDVIGFSGRIYKPTQDGSKYINSPASDIFVKGQSLYHYHKCKDAVKQAGFVYVLEGFMDVIALYKAGIHNSVAIMGTALTKEHMLSLRKLTSHIVLCLDGDKAGLSAMSKISLELEKSGFKVDIIVLPDGADPDEIYENHGEQGLHEILKKRIKPIEFQMDFEYRMIDSSNYDDRKKFLEKISASIANIEDAIDRDYYIHILSEKSQFSYEIVANQVRGLQGEMTKTPIHREVKKTIALVDKYRKAEHDLLFYMMHDKNVALKYESQAGFMYDNQYRVIASYIVDYYRDHNQLQVADLINSIQKEELMQTVIMIAQSDLPLPCKEEAIDDYIHTIALNAKKMKKEQLLEQFNYVLDPSQKAQILNEILKLESEKE